MSVEYSPWSIGFGTQKYFWTRLWGKADVVALTIDKSQLWELVSWILEIKKNLEFSVILRQIWQLVFFQNTILDQGVGSKNHWICVSLTVFRSWKLLISIFDKVFELLKGFIEFSKHFLCRNLSFSPVLTLKNDQNHLSRLF